MKQKQSTVAGKIGTVLILLFLAGYVVWCIWYGVDGLFLSKKHAMEEVFRIPASGDRYEGELPYVSGAYISRSRNIGNRWAGTEYFYVVLSEDQSRAILVRATKHWGDKLGDDAYNEVFKQAKGIVKDFRYKTRKGLSGTFQKLEEAGIQVEKSAYLDLLGIPVRIASLYMGGAIIVFCVYILCLLKKARNTDAKPMPMPIHMMMLILFVLWIAALIFIRNKV